MAAAAAEILIVDDDPGLVMALSLALRDQGYCVAAAHNGRDALDAVERSVPILVLLDVHLPGLDGPGFARALRERGLVPRIVVMTGREDAERWAERMGADDYLPKPFALTELLRTVGCWTD